MTWQHFIDLLKRKNPRFTAFLDSNLHTRLAIVTKNELPPRNFPKKIRPDPSTFYLVIVVTNKQTDKQTDRQTNAGKNIISRFRGDNYGRSSLAPPVRRTFIATTPTNRFRMIVGRRSTYR